MALAYDGSEEKNRVTCCTAEVHVAENACAARVHTVGRCSACGSCWRSRERRAAGAHFIEPSRAEAGERSVGGSRSASGRGVSRWRNSQVDAESGGSESARCCCCCCEEATVALESDRRAGRVGSDEEADLKTTAAPSGPPGVSGSWTGVPDEELDSTNGRSIDDDDEPVVEVLGVAFETLAFADGFRSSLTDVLRLRGCACASMLAVASATAMRSLNEPLADSFPVSRPLPADRRNKPKMRDDLLRGGD